MSTGMIKQALEAIHALSKPEDTIPNTIDSVYMSNPTPDLDYINTHGVITNSGIYINDISHVEEDLENIKKYCEYLINEIQIVLKEVDTMSNPINELSSDTTLSLENKLRVTELVETLLNIKKRWVS